jgi:CotS family spore coat protein
MTVMDASLSNGKLDKKENYIIEKVLKEYDLKLVKFEKTRSAYKVETDKGLICLKKMRHGIKKAENGNNLVNELYDNGFKNTARYIKTKDDKLFVRFKHYIFYVTEWIDGKECDLNDINEAVNCCKLLANFHIAVNKISSKNLLLRNNLKNWPQIFKININDLERFKRIIDGKKIKNEFDVTYYKYIDDFYQRGIAAISFLNKSNYYSLSKEANDLKTICHDSFYYQNILKKDDSYYIIDLDSIILDLQVNDLGKLIRRLMFKNSYQWDFQKTKILIEAYNSCQKLSRSELEVMLALIIFPHKFWKLGNK